MVTKPLPLAIALSASLGLSAPAQTLIPIQNPSFESPDVTLNGSIPTSADSGSTAIADWTIVGIGTAGVWNPSLTPAAGLTAPNGKQVAYIDGNYGTAIRQTVGTGLTANTLYTLSVDVAKRADRNNGSLVLYEIALFVGHLGFASVSSKTPLTSDWTTLTASASTGTILYPGSLEINIFNATGELEFDNVKLTATPVPEPSTTGIVASVSVFGVAIFRRFRANQRSQFSL
jgi:hypothetical protein